ncbi:MAG: hypothetical protein ABIG60_02335 [Patescibacteria group bacterium]
MDLFRQGIENWNLTLFLQRRKKMRKLSVISVICFFGMMLAGAVFAGPGAAPYVDGDDVLVPHIVIMAIPGFLQNPDQRVFAAYQLNGWYVGGIPEIVDPGGMVREGAFWRAKGLKGLRFHPVQLDGSNPPKWAKLEYVYDLREGREPEFIDRTGDGPCLLVK